MNYFKKLFTECFTLKWLVLFIILFIFGFLIRQHMMINAYYEHTEINQWDFLFNFWGDPMIIIYFFIPFWVLFCIRFILDESQSHMLIRLKSWIGWMGHIVFELHFLLVIAIMIWIIVSLLLTIGIPYEDSWSSWALSSSYSNYLVSPFTHLQTSPLVLFLLQIALFAGFMGCLSILLSAAYLTTGRSFVLIALGLFLYLGSIISFKMLPPDWIWLNVTSYVVLIFSYGTFHTLYTGFIMLFLIILLCWTAAAFKSSRHTWKKNVSLDTPLLIYFLLCLCGFFIGGSNEKITSVWDHLYFTFFGVTLSGFRLTTYLYFCIVFLGFIYLFQLRLHHVMNGRIYYILIRHKSLTSWFITFFLKGCVLAILLILSMLLINILAGLIKGQNLTITSTFASVPLFEILYHFILNGFLQLANYMLLSFIAIWIWKESYGGLVAIGIFLVVGLPNINVNQWLPFALNSFGYLSPEHSAFRITAILLLFLIIEMIGVLFILRKRKIVF